MPNFAISGTWKDSREITHYGFHSLTSDGNNSYIIGQLQKKTKTEAVRLLNQTENEAVAILWNYTEVKWKMGEFIHVVHGKPSYLRSNPDNTKRDNLEHLIDYSII